MEKPVLENIRIGNFIICPNDNDTLTIMVDKGAILVKPEAGNSLTVFTASPGRDPQIKYPEPLAKEEPAKG